MTLRLRRWYQNLAPDHHPARHGRGHLWLYSDEPVEKNGRVLDDSRTVGSIGLEWAHLWSRLGFGVKLSTVGEETLDVHYRFPGLAHYWHVDAHRRDGRLLRLPGVRFEAILDSNGAEYRIGSIPHDTREERAAGWRYRRLAWFRITIRLLGRIKTETETLAVRTEAIPLPENDYLATLELQRITRYRERLPWKRKVSYFVETKLPSPGPGLPFPDRKYGGADGIYGMSTRVRRPDSDREWIGAAVGDAVRRTLEYRCRYGRGINDTGLEPANA